MAPTEGRSSSLNGVGAVDAVPQGETSGESAGEQRI